MKTLLSIIVMLFAVNFSFGQTNTFPSNGNVGIGTTTPQEKLEVTGNQKLFGDLIFGSDLTAYFIHGPGNGGAIRFRTNIGNVDDRNVQFGNIDNNGAWHSYMIVDQTGNVGIGTTSPNAKLHIASNTAPGTADILNQYAWSSDLVNWGLRFEQQYNASFGRIQYNWIMKAGTSSDVPMISFVNGLVGIGTQSPDAKLAVNGTIHAKEIKVDLSVPAPDYVFEKNYKLKTLQEVAKYVAINKHLYEIPSAKVMEQKGVNVSELNMKLLQKVEELTLYLIEKDKQLTEQQQVNSEQQNQLKQQDTRIVTLEKALSKLTGNK